MAAPKNRFAGDNWSKHQDFRGYPVWHKPCNFPDADKARFVAG